MQSYLFQNILVVLRFILLACSVRLLTPIQNLGAAFPLLTDLRERLSNMALLFLRARASVMIIQGLGWYLRLSRVDNLQ